MTVIAFPKPSLTWMVGDLRIHEGETDESGRFKVLRAAENQLKVSVTFYSTCSDVMTELPSFTS